MTKIIRYSIHGFKAQYQSYHLKYINYHLNDFNTNSLPNHLKYVVEQRHNKLLPFFKEHYEDFKEGIWIFIDGYKNNQLLNHLKYKVPCWEAEIEDNVIVYDTNWEEIISLNNPIVKIGGCYLPKREINKIYNIKKRISKNRE